VVLTQRAIAPQLLLPDGTHGVLLDGGDWDDASLGAAAPDGLDANARPLHGSHLAYMIYTSGSTGKPKGAANTHEGLHNRLAWMQDAYGLKADDAVLQKTPFGFDVSVWEFFWPLLAGARMVLARPGGHKDAAYLRDLIRAQGVTTAHFVPSMLGVFLAEEGAAEEDADRCRVLRRIICSGEELPADVAARCLQTLPAELHNLYGPTEAAIDVSAWQCTPDALAGLARVPIGGPIQNLRLHVLDRQMRAVPVGVPGELFLGGVGLARGYLRRPALTADRFVPDPFGAAPGERLYRTGDLARWAADGVLEFLGRVDRQVKIRGFRVELGEVESVLAGDERIRQVAVEVWGEHLTAYVVPEGQPLTLADVRAIAAARLPDYMTPTRLALLASLPRTASGKVDRRALPEPAAPGSPVGSDQVWSPMERTIANEVIGPLLGLSELDREQDFFALGGNSLQAMQVTSRVRDRFGVEIGLADFFAEATVAQLARLVEREQRLAAAREHEIYAERAVMASGTVLPQSFPQMALYQAERDDGPNARYHAPFAVRMRGPLDLDALRRSFALLLLRHPTLRVSLRGFLQEVSPNCDPPFVVSDVDGDSVDERMRTVRGLIREEAAVPFDLADGPLIRVRVHRIDQDDHVVQWTVHHLATDGWSLGVQLREIGTAYHAYADGVEPELEPLEGNYAEFVAWHREYVSSEQYTKDLSWWRDRLRGVTGIALPTSAVRAAAPVPSTTVPPRMTRSWSVTCAHPFPESREQLLIQQLIGGARGAAVGRALVAQDVADRRTTHGQDVDQRIARR